MSQLSPFLDLNPNASKTERYKAIGGGPLFPLISSDGIILKKRARIQLLPKERLILKILLSGILSAESTVHIIASSGAAVTS